MVIVLPLKYLHVINNKNVALFLKKINRDIV